MFKEERIDMGKLDFRAKGGCRNIRNERRSVRVRGQPEFISRTYAKNPKASSSSPHVRLVPVLYDRILHLGIFECSPSQEPHKAEKIRQTVR